jgi:hypothetical protein
VGYIRVLRVTYLTLLDKYQHSSSFASESPKWCAHRATLGLVLCPAAGITLAALRFFRKPIPPDQLTFVVGGAVLAVTCMYAQMWFVERDQYLQELRVQFSRESPDETAERHQKVTRWCIGSFAVLVIGFLVATWPLAGILR